GPLDRSRGDDVVDGSRPIEPAAAAGIGPASPGRRGPPALAGRRLAGGATPARRPALAPGREEPQGGIVSHLVRLERAPFWVRDRFSGGRLAGRTAARRRTPAAASGRIGQDRAGAAGSPGR